MNFLSGHDDFFRTGNQPISVRHLSKPYNNYVYFATTIYINICDNFVVLTVVENSFQRQ